MRDNDDRTREDRATLSMDAEWLSFANFGMQKCNKSYFSKHYHITELFMSQMNKEHVAVKL